MRMTLIQDITCLKLFNNSQLSAPPEWLNNLVCFFEDHCNNYMYCVCGTNEQPCTQACNCARADPICENSHIFTILSIITTEDILLNEQFGLFYVIRQYILLTIASIK